MSDAPDSPPAGAPAIRVTAMPADANPNGDIFGGWLMGWMDLAASSAAARHAHGRAVTIAVDGMTFHRPVLVGDEVSFHAELIRVGRSSMTIEVQAWRRAREADDEEKVTQATFTFVAVGPDRRPRPVPPLP